MSGWYQILNRVTTKPRYLNIRSPEKFFVERRGIFHAVNKNPYCEMRSIFTNTSAVPIKTLSHSYATKSNLILDKNNVLSSACENLDITNELLHEFVWKNMGRWPNKTAIVCSTTGRSYTYSQLRTACGRFASFLRKSKFHSGSTVALVLPNVPEFGIVTLGAFEAGVKITTCNPIYTAHEIKRQLENSEASAVVTTAEQYDVVEKSISGNSNIKLPIIVIDDATKSSPSGSIKFSELISDSVEVLGESAITDGSAEDTAVLPYSSGTTGLPKGVELSHRNIVINCRQLQVEGINPGWETTETHQDVVPLILPVFHIYGFTVILMSYLSCGAKIVCLPKFSPEGFLRCLKDFKSTILYVAPPMMLFLGSSEIVNRTHLESVRYAMSGAAPIGADSVQRLLTKADHEIVLAQGYGLTETSPVVSTSNNGMDNLDAVGYLVANTELRVVSTDESNPGRNVGVNEVGEFYVKGPQVMKGYYKNPEATAETMDGEWFKTGDIGCFDNTGYLLIKARLKELIKVKGYQVPPAELEELLRSHNDILDVAVAGEPHPAFGEIPKAYVVSKPGAKPSEDDLMNFVAERVAKYKRLGSVKFVDAIPKNTTGKILRRELKNL